MEQMVSNQPLVTQITMLQCAIDRFQSRDMTALFSGAQNNRVFSRDVTTAMLVSVNNGTAAMLVYLTNPPGIELYYHANVFFRFGGKNKVTDHVSENTIANYGS